MKLFNQYRKRLMPGKGLRKYLLYAIGEILLVVLGILIAVSINNWNASRKRLNMQAELAEKVKSQMVLDTINFGKVIRHNQRSRQLFNLALRETEPNQPLDCMRCASLISGNVNVANMDPKVKHLLRDAELTNDSVSKILRRIEEAYEDSSVILKLLEDSIIQNFKDNLDYLQQYPWFAQLVANNNCNEDCLRYFSTSSDFRNRLAYTELIILKAYDSEVQLFNREIGTFINLLSEQTTKK